MHPRLPRDVLGARFLCLLLPANFPSQPICQWCLVKCVRVHLLLASRIYTGSFRALTKPGDAHVIFLVFKSCGLQPRREEHHVIFKISQWCNAELFECVSIDFYPFFWADKAICYIAQDIYKCPGLSAPLMRRPKSATRAPCFLASEMSLNAS